MTTKTLETPTRAELRAIWEFESIYPTRAGRNHYRASALYQHLDLDPNNPEHQKHVEAIVERREPSAFWRVKETND